MNSRRSLLRGAAILVLTAALIGPATIAPVASASTLDAGHAADVAYTTMNKPKAPAGSNENGPGESGLGDIPIVGDVVGGFKDAEPEEIVTTAVQFAGVAAQTVVPLIRGLIK